MQPQPWARNFAYWRPVVPDPIRNASAREKLRLHAPGGGDVEPLHRALGVKLLETPTTLPLLAFENRGLAIR
eukprot:9767223-Lingulodinium_polyedra.AAC.1